jgi:anti-sigma B factor antagonist
VTTANSAGDFDVTAVIDGASATVVIRGELDVYTAPTLRSRLQELFDAGITHLILDLAELGFIDSSGLGVIVGALKRVKEHEGNLVLRSPSRSTSKVLEITGLSRILDVVDS